MNEETSDHLYRMEEIGTCWSAVGDLMNPDFCGIQERERDHIAVLLSFLHREYALAHEAFSQAIREEVKK